MGLKIKIGKVKLSVNNPVKAVVKAVTAPITAATVGAVSLVSKKEAENLGEKLGLNKDDINAVKAAAPVVAAVATPLIIASAAATVPAAAAAKAAADKVEAAKEKAEELKEKAEAVKAKADEAMPKPIAALPTPAPVAVVDTLFKDNSPAPTAAPATPKEVQASASGTPRDMDFLEKIFAWLAGNI